MFKKIGVFASVVAIAAMLSGCASDKVIDGTKYQTKGLLTTDEMNPNIRYRVSIWSVVWSILFIETVFVPIYLLGFDVLEPTGKIEKIETK